MCSACGQIRNLPHPTWLKNKFDTIEYLLHLCWICLPVNPDIFLYFNSALRSLSGKMNF